MNQQLYEDVVAELHALAEEELPPMLVTIDTLTDYATDFGDSEDGSVASEVDWGVVQDGLQEQIDYLKERLTNIEAMMGEQDG